MEYLMGWEEAVVEEIKETLRGLWKNFLEIRNFEITRWKWKTIITIDIKKIDGRPVEEAVMYVVPFYWFMAYLSTTIQLKCLYSVEWNDNFEQWILNDVNKWWRHFKGTTPGLSWRNWAQLRLSVSATTENLSQNLHNTNQER
jgi:hypothetical protein